MVHADGIYVKHADLSANEEWYYLNADLNVGLTPALEDALNKGISLNFLVEFEMTPLFSASSRAGVRPTFKSALR